MQSLSWSPEFSSLIRSISKADLQEFVSRSVQGLKGIEAKVATDIIEKQQIGKGEGVMNLWG